MKLIYNTYKLLILAILISFTACSSDDYTKLDGNNPNAKTQTVTFVLEGITSKITDIPTRTTSPESSDLQINHLEYWIYDNANGIPYGAEYLSHEVITGDNINKSIKIELATGKYKIFFYATDQDDSTYKNEYGPASIYSVNYKNQMFTKTVEFSISENNTTPVQEIVLEREVGQVQFVINDLDKLPENVKSIRPFLVSTYWSSGTNVISYPGRLNILDGYPGVVSYVGASKTFAPFPILKKEDFANNSIDNPLSFYSLPTSPTTSGSSTLGSGFLYLMGCSDDEIQTFDPVYDAWMGQNPKIIFIKLVGKYTVNKNQITRYTGNIALSSENIGNIIIDNTWNEKTIEIE